METPSPSTSSTPALGWILADPEDVKKVLTADHAVLGVGLANSILGPLLGPRSVMLLEEPEHIRRRKLML